MKKTFRIICLLSITVLMFFVFFRGQSFDKLSIDSEAYNNLIHDKTKSNSLSLQSLQFNEFELIEDDEGRFFYSLSDNDSNWEDPQVRYECNGKCNIRFVTDSGLNTEQIEKNQNTKIVVYNDKEYREYNLVLTTLPLISIKTEERIYDDVHMSFFLFDNREGILQRAINLEGNIHIRGGGTKERNEKRAYKLEFSTLSAGKNKRSNEISLLGLRKDDDYVLYAAMNDDTKVRNVFSASLWNDACAGNNMFNIKNGVEYKYAELFINGNYQGIYALGYKVDKEVVELSDNEVTFKKIHGSLSEFSADFLDNEIYMGYEIENSYLDETESWELLTNYYAQLLNNDRVQEIADIDNNIDVFLFVNLIQGVDHWRDDIRSLYNMFITFKNVNDYYVALYTPWDFDRTWGKELDYSIEPDRNVVFEACPANFLIGDSLIEEKIVNRYDELRNGKWSNTSIISMLEEYEKDIFDSGAYIRDINRWPKTEYKYSEYYDSDIKLTDFKLYVTERLKYMDEYIDSLRAN